MTPVSDNHNEHRPPTGNLEELFRQHLGEAELTPRADMWDRLDHELLVRENQGYRRRLVGYRRAAAAAAAVATLGLGGWLTQHLMTTAPNGQDVAAVVVDGPGAAQGAAARLGEAARQQPADRSQASSTASAAAAQGTAAGVSAASPNAVAANSAQNAATERTVLDNVRESFGARPRSAANSTNEGGMMSQALATIKRTFGADGGATSTGSRLMTANRNVQAGSTASGNAAPAPGLLRGSQGAFGADYPGGLPTAVAPEAWTNGTADVLSPIASRLLRAGQGAGLPDSLKASLLNSSTLLAMQTADAEDEEKKSATESRWRWRSSYAAQRFMPNASSGSSSVVYASLPTNVGTAAPRAAVKPEATQLQAGFVQRAQLGAAVPLSKKHWTLLTGAEVALVSGRTGRQVAQSYNVQNNMLDQKFQTGRYQLTSVGVPVQVRYESRRQGWGVYAAVGAAVNVLLRNRTEVGSQITTGDDSFRRVLASARGNAGVRFSPTKGNWQLNVGPEAEAGLNTLNANPKEAWSQRTRPYSLGLSASVEFGGGRTELAP